MSIYSFILLAACSLFLLCVAGILINRANRVRPLKVSLEMLGLTESDLTIFLEDQIEAWRFEGISTCRLAKAYIDLRVLTNVA